MGCEGLRRVNRIEGLQREEGWMVNVVQGRWDMEELIRSVGKGINRVDSGRYLIR